MKPNPIFRRQVKEFWANVRTVSQEMGYTNRTTKMVRDYTIADLQRAMDKAGLSDRHLIDTCGNATTFATELLDYFTYRANALNEKVEPLLMNAKRAAAAYQTVTKKFSADAPAPMNKQKREKKRTAYLTAIVNTIVAAHVGHHEYEYDPQRLTSFTRDNRPLRTLARRVDGCFPTCIDPIAIWEIKEYYYTTTFGSRIADGVYETLLDGLELEELQENEAIPVQHLLIIDAYDTWWIKGKSYLCRIIDMLHMGYVDEVLFGYEVVEALPTIVESWVALANERSP